MVEVRKNFESQPQFVRAGLYCAEQLNEILHQQPIQKFFACDLMKIRGNLKFKNQEFGEACKCYEQALSMFRYVRINRENWRKDGFADSEIEYFDDNGKTDKEKRLVKGLKIILYQNICLVYLKLSKQNSQLIEDAILASSEAIKLDLKGAKAFFLRAKSRLSRVNLLNDDYKLSIKDLKKALELCTDDNTFIAEELQRCQVKYSQFLNLEVISKSSKQQLSDSTNSQNNQQNSTLNTSKKNNNNNNQNSAGNSKTNNDKINCVPQPQAFSTEEDEQQNLINCVGELKGKLTFEKSQGNLFCNISFEINPQTKIPGEIRELEQNIEQINTRLEQLLKYYEDTSVECCKNKHENNQNQHNIYESDIEFRNMLLNSREYVLQTQQNLYNLARMDLNKPSQSLKDLADIQGIDLKNSLIISQFKQLIEENISDIRENLHNLLTELQYPFQDFQDHNMSCHENCICVSHDLKLASTCMEDNQQVSKEGCESFDIQKILPASTQKQTEVQSSATIIQNPLELSNQANEIHQQIQDQQKQHETNEDKQNYENNHKENGNDENQLKISNNNFSSNDQLNNTNAILDYQIQQCQDNNQQLGQRLEECNEQYPQKYLHQLEESGQQYQFEGDQNFEEDGENNAEQEGQINWNQLTTQDLLESLSREGTLLRELAFQLNSCGISTEEDISKILDRIRWVKEQAYGGGQGHNEGGYDNDEDEEGNQQQDYDGDHENELLSDEKQIVQKENDQHQQEGREKQREINENHQHKNKNSSTNNGNSTMMILSIAILAIGILGVVFYQQLLNIL